jgi:hypothetical protein
MIKFTFVILLLASVALWAQDKPQPTHEDELTLQVVLLKAQLAQALLATAKCEANGSQSAQFSREAQEAGQALIKSLDNRGLTLDGANKIVPKPEPPKPGTK